MTKDCWRIFRWSKSPKGIDREKLEEVWTMKEARVLFYTNKRTLAFHSLNIPWTPRNSSCLLTNFLRPLSIAFSIDNIDKKPFLNLVPLEKSSIKLGLERILRLAEITWPWWESTKLRKFSRNFIRKILIVFRLGKDLKYDSS